MHSTQTIETPVDLPRNLTRLRAKAQAAGWTAATEAQPAYCALVLTALPASGETVLRCVWKSTAHGYRWDGAVLTVNGQKARDGIAWREVGTLVSTTLPARPDLSKYGERSASPVTAEVVSADIAATPAGKVPVMLRPWAKPTVPVTLYPSRFVGRDYVGADCLLITGGHDAAPDADPVLSALPADYLTSNAAYHEDLTAHAIEQGRSPAQGREFARWVISSDMLTFGVFDGAYAAWEQSLTCTKTARHAILTCTRMNGTALRLECGCGQRHPGRPWESATVWDDKGCHYLSLAAVPMDRIADLITRQGYRVTGEWSTYQPTDVIRRARVEPLPARPDPGSVDGWEYEGGACPGLEAAAHRVAPGRIIPPVQAAPRQQRRIPRSREWAARFLHGHHGTQETGSRPTTAPPHP
ncbi:hypothetical protein ABZV34_27020 [Streptomyces sp. NPDC005195]|uniref:hypothetical protein n=1 Tax=Streptomyces sp. NPDC005195 TaxID=3154561 RepID=UPI0033B46A83